MELARYLAIIRRWWWTIVVATWAAGLAAYLAASQLPQTYEAKATVLVGPVSADFDTQRAAGQLVETYAEIIPSRPIVRATIQDLGLPDSDATLARRISAIADTTTRFLTIRVQYDDPQTAADIANNLVDQLSKETTSATIRPEGEPRLWEEAIPNEEPIAPEVGLITFLAAAAGLAAALILVTAVEYLIAPIRDPLGLATASGTDTIAAVDTWRPRSSSTVGRLLVEVAPDSTTAVGYRLLARRLRTISAGSVRSVCIVSAAQRTGGGEVAANIAAALALRGDRVALVDANDDEQEVSRLLGRWGQRGLDDIVERGSSALKGLIGQDDGLPVIPHGPRVSLPLVDDTDARNIINLIADGGAFDLIVIDAGVATPSSNTLLWASAADATIVVAKRDQTRSSEVSRAAELVNLSGANVIGSVLHMRRLRNVKYGGGRRPSRDQQATPASRREDEATAPTSTEAIATESAASPTSASAAEPSPASLTGLASSATPATVALADPAPEERGSGADAIEVTEDREVVSAEAPPPTVPGVIHADAETDEATHDAEDADEGGSAGPEPHRRRKRRLRTR
jgi:capsular polysaccharide biosynthesis protein/Mrp family chromosome partitioning ATPase